MTNVHDDRSVGPADDQLALILGEIRKLGDRLDGLKRRLDGRVDVLDGRAEGDGRGEGDGRAEGAGRPDGNGRREGNGRHDGEGSGEGGEGGEGSVAPAVPSLAVRSDGKVLLAIAFVEGADLAGRERWEGIVLSVAEASDVVDAVSDAVDDAAARTGGRILWRGKKPEGDPGEGSGGSGGSGGSA